LHSETYVSDMESIAERQVVLVANKLFDRNRPDSTNRYLTRKYSVFFHLFFLLNLQFVELYNDEQMSAIDLMYTSKSI